MRTKGYSFWWPYLSVSRVLLQTQDNASAYLNANLQLLEEMQAITRKEHELILSLSEQIADLMSTQNLSQNALLGFKATDLDAVYEKATHGIREIGQAWVEAQVRSLELLREHARKLNN